MSNIVLTEKIETFLRAYVSFNDSDLEFNNSVLEYLEAKKKRIRPGIYLSPECWKDIDEAGDIWVKTIPFKIVRQAWSKFGLSLNETIHPDIPSNILDSFAEIIRGSSFFFEAEKKPCRSPEFEALLDRLRVQYEERHYRMLSGCLDCNPNSKRNEWQDVKLAQKELGLILNLLFSVIGCFFALFFLSHYILADLGQRILLSFAVCLLVAVAEGRVYYFRAMKAIEKKMS